MSEMSEQSDHDPAPATDAEPERSEMSLETPPEDAVEQHAELSDDEESRPQWPRRIPFDADEADAADQERPVELDEDDYR